MSTSFHQLTISKITKEAAKTVALTFSIPEALKPNFKFKAGQYLTLRTTINGEDVRRSYSICSVPGEGDLTVAVKAISKGLFSNHAYDNLKEGDEVSVMEPMGNFIIKESNSSKKHVFFAAGSGITPIISMVKTILKTQPESEVNLFYGNRSAAETIFKSELDALSADHEKLHVNYVYSREDSGSPLFNGRITSEKIEEIYNTKLNGTPIDDVYVCGPEPMINAVKDFFKTKNISADNIHFELFGTPSIEKDSKPKMAGEVVNSAVTVIIDDEEYEFSLKSNGKDVLQAAQDMGADVPFSCKGGVCCTCRAKIIEGSASMDMNFALEETEIEEGFVLTCQAHPTSDKLVVSFDEY